MPAVITEERTRQTVYEFVLGVPLQDSAAFRSMLEDFQFEDSRAVGHEYVFFEYYIDEANEWTPFQGRKIGSSFIAMQLHEVDVKEKFYAKLHAKFGPSFAARFLALHEYLNIMSKLKVWSDYAATPD